MQQIYEFIANKQAISRVFMLFLCCLLLSTPTFAQSSNAWITIHKKNISVIEALKEVEKSKRKLSVGYNESQLKNKPPSFGVGKSHVGELSHRKRRTVDWCQCTWWKVQALELSQT